MPLPLVARHGYRSAWAGGNAPLWARCRGYHGRVTAKPARLLPRVRLQRAVIVFNGSLGFGPRTLHDDRYRRASSGLQAFRRDIAGRGAASIPAAPRQSLKRLHQSRQLFLARCLDHAASPPSAPHALNSLLGTIKNRFEPLQCYRIAHAPCLLIVVFRVQVCRRYARGVGCEQGRGGAPVGASGLPRGIAPKYPRVRVMCVSFGLDTGWRQLRLSRG